MIDNLVNSRIFKQYIIKDYNVLGVYIGGSRQTGLDGETSDYDLVVIYDEPYNIPNESFIQINYKDTHIHWYYTNIREFASYRDSIIGAFGKIYPFNLETKFIYKGINLDFLNKYKEDYFRISAYKLYTGKLSRFKENLFNFHQLQYTKVLYYGEVMYSLMVHNTIDKEFLKAIKYEIRHDSLTEEHIIKINNHLTYIKNYIDSLKDFDLDYEITLLNMKIYEEYQKCIQTN